MKKQGFSILVVLTLVMAFSTHRSFGKERGVQPASLFRLDYQYGALNPWLFYEVPLSANVGLLTVWQMSTQGFAQIDIGPVFHLGNWQLIPQVGIDFFESSQDGARIGHIVPEFYAIHTGAMVSFESWNLCFIKAHEEPSTFYYYRDHLLCRAGKWLALGPQIEGYLFPDAKPDHYFGGHVDIDAGAGTIGLFYGQNRDQRGVFRMTFLKFF